MTDKEKVFEYAIILARLEGSVLGICAILESGCTVKTAIKRLEAAVKTSINRVDKLTNK